MPTRDEVMAMSETELVQAMRDHAWRAPAVETASPKLDARAMTPREFHEAMRDRAWRSGRQR